jgi:hypothetical protein
MDLNRRMRETGDVRKALIEHVASLAPAKLELVPPAPAPAADAPPPTPPQRRRGSFADE